VNGPNFTFPVVASNAPSLFTSVTCQPIGGRSSTAYANVPSGGYARNTTTNGTPALVAAQGGETVLVGAPVNFKALVERARALLLEPRDLVIICAGREKQFAIEDAYTAGRLIKAAKKGLRKLVLNDAARAALALTDEVADWSEALEGSEAAHQLGEVDLAEDVAFAARPDRFGVVPSYADRRIT
jgi:2-phosphosulfolactate phosphatase